MIIYILSTYLISLAGALCYYVFAQNRFNPLHCKYWIYGIVACSFLLPLGILIQQPSVPGRVQHSFHEVPRTDNSSVIINEASAEAASGRACSMDEKCSAILFQESRLANLFLGYGSYLLKGLAGISGIVLLLMLTRIFYLFYLSKTLKQEKTNIEGKIYWVLYSDRKASPGSFRLWHKYILWPTPLDGLNRKERAAILKHEISHLEQRSTWEKLVLYIVQAFWLLNPAFYFFRKQLQKLNEFIADTGALDEMENPRQYAELLVKLKEQPALAVVHHFTGSSLKDRILRILYPLPPCTCNKYLKIAVTLCLLFVTATYGPGVFQQQAKAYDEYRQLYQMHSTTGDIQFCRTESAS